MSYPSTRFSALVAAVFGCALLQTTPATAADQLGSAATSARAFTALPGSATPASDAVVGNFESANMTVDVVLAPRNEAQLAALLTAVYDPSSANYGHWLGKGRFEALFAPGAEQRAAVERYLQANGLTVGRSSSPFLVRAGGPSRSVAAAFRTNLVAYRNRSGISYYSNAAAVRVPIALASSVRGVLGLANTIRMQPRYKRSLAASAATARCEAPYPTVPQLVAAVNHGVYFPFGYGAGPGCNGLTPSQDNAIYGAPRVGARGKGAGVSLALFELSAYQHSDIEAWTKYFYGRGYAPHLVDIAVDGGPLSPKCPSNDTCPLQPYAGDIEVDADIETQLAVAPDARRTLVYNAPNDYTGQTSLDEYARVANDDVADVLSSSWGVCENDAGAAYVQAENVIFEQMALQGQSFFSAAGDTGAFGCIRNDGTTIVNVGDPATPWVTVVGGTSFGYYNPGVNPEPAYPRDHETVWNVDDLCNASANEGGHPGFLWCALTGAGTGGNSEFWGRPFYQYGPGVTNPYTAYGNGTTNCNLARKGTQCRELPDISADADEYTPYAEYCTANASTPSSSCGFSSAQTPAGWFGIGGTSLSSPLWSGILADRDSFQGHRTGNANPLLYLLFDRDPQGYFNDMTDHGQKANNNGLFPVAAGFDLATGIGTPKMSALITGFPSR